MQYLLENTNSNPFDTDFNGNTSLHLACLSGNSHCVLTLLQLTEKNLLTELINALNCNQQSAIHLASLKNLKPVIYELLVNGAEVRESDNFGYIPSMYCCRDPMAAACLNMIETIMELEIRASAHEEQKEGDDSLIEANISVNRHSNQLSNRSTLFRASLSNQCQNLIEHRLRNKSFVSNYDNFSLSSKTSLKDTSNTMGEGENSHENSKDISTLTEHQKGSPNSDPDFLVDSDSEMY